MRILVIGQPGVGKSYLIEKIEGLLRSEGYAATIYYSHKADPVVFDCRPPTSRIQVVVSEMDAYLGPETDWRELERIGPDGV